MSTEDGQQNRGKLVVVTGPAGVGKSTIVREVLHRTGAAFSVSATTRAPRPGETDGRHYQFMDRAAFQQMIDQDELLEWAEVFGNFYGTPAGAVDEAVAAGQTVILEIDVQGGLQIHAKRPAATFVLILPPSREVLEQRLRGRGTETPESLSRRLAKAEMEIETARDSGAYEYEVINNDLEAAIEQVAGIVTQESPRA